MCGGGCRRWPPGKPGSPPENLVVVRCPDRARWAQVTATLLEGLGAVYAEVPLGDQRPVAPPSRCPRQGAPCRAAAASRCGADCRGPGPSASPGVRPWPGRGPGTGTADSSHRLLTLRAGRQGGRGSGAAYRSGGRWDGRCACGSRTGRCAVPTRRRVSPARSSTTATWSPRQTSAPCRQGSAPGCAAGKPRRSAPQSSP